MTYCPYCKTKILHLVKDVSFDLCLNKDCRFCEVTEPPNMMGDRPNTYQTTLSEEKWQKLTKDVDTESESRLTNLNMGVEVVKHLLDTIKSPEFQSKTFYQVEYFNREPYTGDLEDERLVLISPTIYSNKETLIKKLESQGFKYHTLDDLYSSNNLENPIALFGAGNQVHAKIHKLTLESGGM